MDWLSPTADLLSIGGLVLTIWTLVLVRQFKDQRARLLGLPGLLDQFVALTQPSAFTEPNVLALLRRADALLEATLDKIGPSAKPRISAHRQAIAALLNVNTLSDPSLADAVARLQAALVTIGDIVRTETLNEP